VKGWHLLQLQNPAGLFSNEYLIRVDSDAKSGDFNLRDALLRGDDRLALNLLQHGAPINNPGDEGSTAVHSAAFFGREEPLAYMLSHGADLKKRNGGGQLPVDVVSGPLDDGLYGFYTAIGRATGVEFKRDVLESGRKRNAERLRK
jgi:ankyrin repeat protein